MLKFKIVFRLPDANKALDKVLSIEVKARSAIEAADGLKAMHPTISIVEIKQLYENNLITIDFIAKKRKMVA